MNLTKFDDKYSMPRPKKRGPYSPKKSRVNDKYQQFLEYLDKSGYTESFRRTIVEAREKVVQ